MRVYLGIDPGLTGAIVAVNAMREIVGEWEMPVLEKARPGIVKYEVDARRLCGIVKACEAIGEIGAVYLEQVGAWSGVNGRKQGGESMFSFGDSFGAVRAIVLVCGYDVTRIAPAAWKAAMKLIRAEKGKREALERAKQLFPKSIGLFQRVKDIPRAEAALIALLACWNDPASRAAGTVYRVRGEAQLSETSIRG